MRSVRSGHIINVWNKYRRQTRDQLPNMKCPLTTSCPLHTCFPPCFRGWGFNVFSTMKLVRIILSPEPSIFSLLSYPKHFLGYRLRILTWVAGGLGGKLKPEKCQACSFQHDLYSFSVIPKQKEQRYLNMNHSAQLPTGSPWKWQHTAGSWPRVHAAAARSQTLPFLNIWRDLRKEFASVNPDWPIKTRRFQVQWLISGKNCAWWKGNFVCWGNLYPEISHVTGVRITWRHWTLKRPLQTFLPAACLSSPRMRAQQCPGVSETPRTDRGSLPHRACSFASVFPLMLSAHKVGITIPSLWEETKAWKDQVRCS